mgnify:CR=1 FL=1|jgi:2-polyprenyl-3-methyl-5-hydroxy-6-metoxy-1,4-benzoquinol methylase|tara:strand:- start:411 stop:1574 length:1164 start_codon:yes stop_codon:yes gene_type:complete
MTTIKYPELAYVNPNKLVRVLKLNNFGDEIKKEMFSSNGENQILGGDWDLNLSIPFEELDVFKSIQSHFIEGKNWNETRLYTRVSKEISNNKIKWGCRTPDEYLKRLEENVESVYLDIKNHGFKTQRELGTLKKSDEIRIAIDRNGEAIFMDGRHRLAIAKILKLNKIPVKIILRHEQWTEFQKTIFQYAKNDSKGKIYQLIEHPDLDFIPAHHKDDRFDFLEKAISEYDCLNKELIDIGTHWGHMSHKFEDLGFKCTAVEKLTSNIHYLENIRNACGKTFDIWQGNIFDYPDIEKMDVILALNIFHHFCKTEDDHNEFIKLLNRMNAEIMLFQAHRHNPPGQMEGAFRNYNETEFVEFISKNTGLNKWEKLGVAADKRPLYKLWKS